MPPRSTISALIESSGRLAVEPGCSCTALGAAGGRVEARAARAATARATAGGPAPRTSARTSRAESSLGSPRPGAHQRAPVGCAGGTGRRRGRSTAGRAWSCSRLRPASAGPMRSTPPRGPMRYRPGGAAVPDRAVAGRPAALCSGACASGLRVQRDTRSRVPVAGSRRSSPATVPTQTLPAWGSTAITWRLRMRRRRRRVAPDLAAAQVQPGARMRIRAHPQRLVAFRRQRGDVAVGQAGGVARVVPVRRVALAVVAVQAALRGRPRRNPARPAPAR